MGGKTLKSSNTTTPAPTTDPTTSPKPSSKTLSVLQSAASEVGLDDASAPTHTVKHPPEVKSLSIAAALQSPPAIGDSIEAQFKQQGKFYPGTVANVHDDNSIDVNFSDGDKDTAVPPSSYRLPAPSPSQLSSPSSASTKWAVVGDSVEAQFKGKGKFYKGTVKNVHDDNSIDVTFDDGDKVRQSPFPSHIPLHSLLSNPRLAYPGHQHSAIVLQARPRRVCYQRGEHHRRSEV